MKILQISSVPVSFKGGTEKVVWEISKRLAEKNEVTILQTNLYDSSTKSGLVLKKNVKIITFPNEKFLGGYGYSKKAINWLKNNYKKYDLIHAHGYNRYLSEFSLHYLKGKVPLIFTPHGFAHTKKNYFFKKIHDLIIGRFLKNANICTALTKLDYKYYKKLGVQKNKIIELPNGIDLEKFSKISKQKLSKFKKKYSLKKPFLLSVGRIHKSKGLQYVIKAIKTLDISFVIIGEDFGFKKELERIIVKEKVKNKVKFLDKIGNDDLSLAYHSAYAFILFSEWEGFGIVMIEAMAAGIPVIVSNRGSLPFLVKNGENGLIAEFGNQKSLRKKIEILLENKILKEKISKKGLKFSKKYSWKKISKKTEKIYKEVIKKWNLEK